MSAIPGLVQRASRFAGGRRGAAGRGRPPQAAARRAGLEVVEKLLTTLNGCLEVVEKLLTTLNGCLAGRNGTRACYLPAARRMLGRTGDWLELRLALVVAQRRLGSLVGHDSTSAWATWKPTIPAVLVVEAAPRPAAQLQPVLLELPHACPFRFPGRAVCPALGTGGRWTPWHAERPPGASDGANELGRFWIRLPSGLGCRVDWRRLWLGSGMPAPSGQIPPPWAW
jgi:hypothetical protein